MNGEWSIQDLAKAAKTTSRTLRHYGEVGLLEPSRIGANGYRFYDQNALVRRHFPEIPHTLRAAAFAAPQCISTATARISAPASESECPSMCPAASPIAIVSGSNPSARDALPACIVRIGADSGTRKVTGPCIV